MSPSYTAYVDSHVDLIETVVRQVIVQANRSFDGRTERVIVEYTQERHSADTMDPVERRRLY